MKHRLALGLMVVAALVTSVRPADANIWDWMQEWSGPGPFLATRDRPPFFFNLCPSDFRRAEVENPPACFYLDYRNLTADANGNFPIRVTVWFLEVGTTRRARVGPFKTSVELGYGLGVMSVTGDKAVGGQNAMRVTVTAPRAVFLPFMMVAEGLGGQPNPSRLSTKIARMFKFQIGGTAILGSLDAQDLGVDPSRSSYKRSFEYVLSRGVWIDIGELFSKGQSSLF